MPSIVAGKSQFAHTPSLEYNKLTTSKKLNQFRHDTFPDSISSKTLNLETVSISYDAIWLKNPANLSFPRGANVTNLLLFLLL